MLCHRAQRVRSVYPNRPNCLAGLTGHTNKAERAHGPACVVLAFGCRPHGGRLRFTASRGRLPMDWLHTSPLVGALPRREPTRTCVRIRCPIPLTRRHRRENMRSYTELPPPLPAASVGGTGQHGYRSTTGPGTTPARPAHPADRHFPSRPVRYAASQVCSCGSCPATRHRRREAKRGDGLLAPMRDTAVVTVTVSHGDLSGPLR